MQAPKLVAKSKGPIINPGLCRCCRSIKKCRLLSAEYEWSGQKEVYSTMFMDCFGLLISHLDNYKESGICATCVVRLRAACDFREQVLRCQQEFLQTRYGSAGEPKYQIEVKSEPSVTNSYDDNDQDNGLPSPSLSAEGRPLLEISLPRGFPKRTAMRGNGLPLKRKITRSAAKRDPLKDQELPTVPAKKLKIEILRKRTNDENDKRKLIAQMKIMRGKFEKMLDKRALLIQRKQKQRAQRLEKSAMKFFNELTFILNSYICPFQHRGSLYHCFYCKVQFTNPDELREHTLCHDPKDSYEKNRVKQRTTKVDITRIDCRLCDEKIHDLPTLRAHLIKAHKIKVFPVTNEFFTFKLFEDRCVCTECGTSFLYFDVLLKHMSNHFGSYVCEQCGACFIERASFLSHIRDHQKTSSSRTCGICGKEFISETARNQHVLKIHEKKPPLNCNKCEASFSSYGKRNKHLMDVHGEDRTFPCKKCGKVFYARTNLTAHDRTVHLKLLKHKCEVCNHRFYALSVLKAHMAKHTGERNFICELCGKSYFRVKHLQAHVREVHSNKIFKCDVCDVQYPLKQSLQRHMKVHNT